MINMLFTFKNPKSNPKQKHHKTLMLLTSSESQLVLIDYQTRLLPAIFESDIVIAQALKLAQIAKILRIPITGTEQNPEGLGQNQADLRALCGQTLVKSHFDGCVDGLGDLLRDIGTPKPSPNARSMPKHMQKDPENQRPTIVLAGMETHVCFLQTALSLIEEEFDVWVVTDACGSRTEKNRDAAFDRLAGNGAELVTVEMVAFEWLESSDHPQFKAVLNLIK
jgi:nicotinamidase-related amidase